MDALQEKRLDAIAEAAQKRIEALRAQLADMREHREEFVEEEVERLVKGPRGGKGPHGGEGMRGEGMRGGKGPRGDKGPHGRMPAPREEGEAVEGGMPPPPPMEGQGFWRGHRPPRRDGRGPGPCMKRGGPGGEGPEDAPEGAPEVPPEAPMEAPMEGGEGAE